MRQIPCSPKRISSHYGRSPAAILLDIEQGLTSLFEHKRMAGTVLAMSPIGSGY